MPAFHPLLAIVVIVLLLLHGKIEPPKGGVVFKGCPGEQGGKIGTSHDGVVTLGGRGAQNER